MEGSQQTFTPKTPPLNPESLPTQTDTAAAPLPPPKSRRRYIPNLVSWIVGSFVLLILVGIALPVTNSGCIKGIQTQSLARAKQVGLALKIFAGDHDGEYPRAGLPVMLGAEVKNSNAAFAVLFPTYLQNETLFGNKQSAYQTRQPDNLYDAPYTGKPGKTLEPGENVYAYVAGLTDNDPMDTPLVADGTDGTGHYTTDVKKRGGTWEGKRAIVIHLDNSGSVETLTGPDHARYIQRRDGESHRDLGNLLDVAGIGPNVRLLEPAVDRR